MLDKHASRLRQVIQPMTWLCLSDVTDGHTREGIQDGRALHAEGLELLILVVSPVFEGLTLLKRQRMINDVLREDLQTGILHSVRMNCWTPTQWEQNGKPSSFRPGVPCFLPEEQQQ